MVVEVVVAVGESQYQPVNGVPCHWPFVVIGNNTTTIYYEFYDRYIPGKALMMIIIMNAEQTTRNKIYIKRIFFGGGAVNFFIIKMF